MLKKPITAETLRCMNACEEDVKLFEKNYPNGLKSPNIATFRKLMALGLKEGVEWFFQGYLHHTIMEAYDEALGDETLRLNRENGAWWWDDQDEVDEYELFIAARMAEAWKAQMKEAGE